MFNYCVVFRVVCSPHKEGTLQQPIFGFNETNILSALVVVGWHSVVVFTAVAGFCGNNKLFVI